MAAADRLRRHRLLCRTAFRPADSAIRLAATADDDSGLTAVDRPLRPVGLADCSDDGQGLSLGVPGDQSGRPGYDGYHCHRYACRCRFCAGHADPAPVRGDPDRQLPGPADYPPDRQTHPCALIDDFRLRLHSRGSFQPRQSAGQARCQRQYRQQRGLIGVIKVRFARPDVCTWLVAFVQLMAPAAMLMIDEQSLVELPETAIPVFILLLAGTLQQRSGRSGRFAMSPVQAMTDYRLVLPVKGVDDTGGTVDIPAVVTAVGKQLACVVQQPFGIGTPGVTTRSLQMQQQSSPLKGVPRSGAERPKAVGRVFTVVVWQGLPVTGEVLDDLKMVGTGMLMDNPLDDAQRPVEPLGIASHVGQCEKGLGAVHVAVRTAIGLLAAPVPSERLTHGAFLLTPEAGLDHLDSIGQQCLCTGPPRHYCRTGGQRNESMQISLFIGSAAVFERGAEPATVFGITQRAMQCRNTMIDQRCAAGYALRMCHGKTVRHACGIHGLSRGADHQTAVVIKTAKTIVQPGSLGEGQQTVAFQCQPLVVSWRAQPAAEGVIIIIHDAMPPPSIRLCPDCTGGHFDRGHNARPVVRRQADTTCINVGFYTLKRETT
ncbi:Uncharacterized protein ALO68_05699 [Pseudomonas syringae pv. helianthi]|uniref:Uncharacterized protein n=5 Tax=Pseudomonas syringae group TaxID=136849 RepID=A0A0P9RGD8_9PSED|nr:Uncharacterized protein ALO68_05699 [Pseudomonas syringae pv. helianthi]